MNNQTFGVNKRFILSRANGTNLFLPMVWIGFEDPTNLISEMRVSQVLLVLGHVCKTFV